MQLYVKGGFKIDQVKVDINNKKYGFCCNVQKFAYLNKSPKKSVEDSLPQFLKVCYSKIDYTCTTKIWLRNISYVVANKSRNIEDNFLLYFKFIECFYKSKNEKGVARTFISKAIEEHFFDEKYTGEELEKLSREIICLRNHYVHAGYFIKNNSLRISAPKNEKNSTFVPYTVSVDFEWIFERTRIMNKITIDIIYREILGYENYQ